MTKTTTEVPMDIEKARFNMVEQQIRTWNVLDPVTLDLVQSTPRELFVPAHLKAQAFSDCRLDIGHNQEMLAPKEEARIIQALAIKPSDVVLEVGTGSGYLTALLAKQAKHLYSVDIIPEFINDAQEKLSQLAINNVNLEVADAASGWEHHAPYDVVVIGGSLPNLPESFAKSLKADGRLFAFLGQVPAMSAVLYTKKEDNKFEQTTLFETVVERLINAPREEQFTF